MKVLLVSDYGTLTGGAELAAHHLRSELRRRGHEVRWLASSAGRGKVEADDTCFGTTSRWRTLLQTVNPFAWFKLRRVLASFHPDVVIVSMFLTQLSPLILPLLRRYPTVYRAHWYRPVCPKGTKLLSAGSLCTFQWGRACHREGCLPPWDWAALEFQRWLLHRWRRTLDLTIADGRVQAEILEANGWNVDAIVSPATIASQIARQGSGECVALFVGRLVKEKGVDVLLCAFEKVLDRIPEARLRIIGDGPDRARLVNLAGPIQHAVDFLPSVTHERLGDQLRKARVLVMPSVWHEPFGLIVLDAQLAGVPVIVSDSAGAADCVQDGVTGIHVPAREVAPLADAMMRILSDEKLAARMGDAAVTNSCKEYGPDAHTDKILRTCEEAYERKSAIRS